ncbi:hypothetical protein DFH28DRAFT_1172068 [Melampsora americana]|nr:hypothetical protein DFH28DRAFT_1172068 [Melampsora americana]
MTTTFQLPSSTFEINQDGDFTPYDGRSLVDTSIYTSSYQSDPELSDLKSASGNPAPYLPMQTARTRATSDALDRILSTQAEQFAAVCEVWRSKFSSTAFVPSIPKEKGTVKRSRATSDALERILARQSRQLTKLGELWRNKFSSSPSTSLSKRGNKDGMIESHNRDDVDFSEMVEDENVQRDYELEKKVLKWMDHFPDSFDYIVERIESLDF